MALSGGRGIGARGAFALAVGCAGRGVFLNGSVGYWRVRRGLCPHLDTIPFLSGIGGNSFLLAGMPECAGIVSDIVYNPRLLLWWPECYRECGWLQRAGGLSGILRAGSWVELGLAPCPVEYVDIGGGAGVVEELIMPVIHGQDAQLLPEVFLGFGPQ